MLPRDTFGPRFHDPDVQHRFSHTGQPGEDLARLALIAILPFAERRADAPAADAVRSRIAGTYLLALSLTDAGAERISLAPGGWQRRASAL